MQIVDQVLLGVHRGHHLLARAAWRARPGDRRTLTWPEATGVSQLRQVTSVCNICGWRGRGFGGIAHSESAVCPVCGSIGRDRFLYWCWVRRTAYDRAAVVLETSPRLDARYRERMGLRVAYTASDYDESSHRGVVKLDLQDMDLPDASVDVVLTPHVLEHVPDTDRALAELFRVLRPGGDVFLQIPLPQGRTGVPTEPEYHGDRTLVYFRFGWDLADRIRSHGFTCQTLVTSELRDAAANGHSWVHDGADCDVDDLMATADAGTMTVVADAAQAARYGFRPAYQFVTFHMHRPGAATPP